MQAIYHMGRLPYVDPEELPAEKRHLLDTLSDEDDETEERDHALRGGTLNVYQVMANNPALLEAFRSYGKTVWEESGLSPFEREFVILSVAYHTESAYEWQQHVRVSLDEGMTPEQITAVSSDDLDRLDVKHAAIVRYVTDFVDGSVDDAAHTELNRHFDDDVVLGIGLLAGAYLGLSRLLDALEIDTEINFVGWNLEDL